MIEYLKEVGESVKGISDIVNTFCDGKISTSNFYFLVSGGLFFGWLALKINREIKKDYELKSTSQAISDGKDSKIEEVVKKTYNNK